MKKTALALSVVALLGLTACSSTKNIGMNPPSETTTAVKDAKISTDFRDQGIKIYYTLLGDLDRIEVYGIAPAWKGNVDILAEMDAKEKLIKFVHGESVTSERRARIIARSLDKAQDNTSNRFKTADGSANFDAADLDKMDGNETRDNNSTRNASRIENTLVNTVTTITASGRLTGVRKIRDGRMQDGKFYVAVYQWSEKDQGVAEMMRGRMR
jgi:hypothetical protein